MAIKKKLSNCFLAISVGTFIFMALECSEKKFSIILQCLRPNLYKLLVRVGQNSEVYLVNYLSVRQQAAFYVINVTFSVIL